MRCSNAMFNVLMSARNSSVRCGSYHGILPRVTWSLQIALVELILPFMEYMEAKRCYTDAKAKQRALHKRVQTLQQKNQPMHDFKKRLETRLKGINEQRDRKKEAAKKRFRSMKAKWDENEKLVYQYLSFECSHQPVALRRNLEPRRFRTSFQILRRKKKIAPRRFRTLSGVFKTSKQTWQSPSKSKI
jgi:hypothetical protein